MRKRLVVFEGRVHFDLVWFLAKSRASTHSTIMRNTNCGLHGGERHLEFFRSPPRAPSNVLFVFAFIYVFKLFEKDF